MNITVDRAVIEQALKALEWEFGLNPVGKKTHETIIALRTALGQQYMTNAAGELEPVTVVQTGVGIKKQEPVAWMLGDKFYKVKQCRFFSKNPGEEIPGQIPLYTAPPQRNSLSDEEIQKMRHLIDWTAEWSYINFARAIEAAHNIKE